MKRIAVLALLFLLPIGFALAEEPPDWSRHEFAAPIDATFAAALKSVQQQRHDVKDIDEKTHTIDFHIGTTAWSWGYDMKLTVTAIDETHCRVAIEISRSGGKALSWGSGKKEVRKIYDGIDRHLIKEKAGS